MDLIAPGSRDDVQAALREATASRSPIALVGGETHEAKGNPIEVDRALSLTSLDHLVAFDPAEMLAVVEGGMRIGTLRERLADGGQEWPVDAPDDATVGGVVATAPSSPRRLRFGPLRDSLVEVEFVTGDGRLVRSGARTVKSVQGYDVHRLATGSLGTLGAIVQVAVKVRPLARARRLVITSGGGVETGRRLLDAVPLPTSVVATADHVEVGLEGWPEEIEEQTEALRAAATVADVIDDRSSVGPEEIGAPVVVEVAVAPSRLVDVLDDLPDFRALLGVGIAWVGLPDDGERLVALRRRVAALDVHRRLKAAFDPAHILAPGRFWDGL